MAEIKTCEQYVLNRLAELEDMNEDLQELVAVYEKSVKDLERCVAIFRRYAEIHSFKGSLDNESNYYLTMTVDGWGCAQDKQPEVQDFNFLVQLVGLKLNKEE